ncbi:EamA family transporter [Labedaea rhizosphaerae]|uniref:EamA-like transporter family protein n=1 Tax=Labedaea rhizosphaerae TaxID=598644 RepID=A0A4R6SK14_LABRH|nr:EamA family transporter [Labedaea rhizosphaerae]TDQ04191.1 EamA-like transporter family protein [Labedaea rhizosphaerae]
MSTTTAPSGGAARATRPFTARASGLSASAGALAALIVGGSVPVTGMLAGYPVLTGQALRYLLGGLLLLGWAALRRRPVPMPALRDLPALVGLAATGMLGFNAFMIAAQRWAEPGFVAAVLGATPLLLAIVAPLAARRRPAPGALLGALAVLAGVALLSGGGSWHGPGLVLSVLTMLGEASFTLLAVGVIARLGALAVATWTCLIAAVGGAAAGTIVDGAAAWRLPDARETTALIVLGVLVTAVAFGLWYHCVSVLGADRAGVLIGLMPVAGLIASVALGAQPLDVVDVVGAVAVGAGCAIGVARRRAPS